MEMIMKAIKAILKEEHRKNDATRSVEAAMTPNINGGGKLRCSSSSYRNSNTFDSNLNASYADECKPEPKCRNWKRTQSKYR